MAKEPSRPSRIKVFGTKAERSESLREELRDAGAMPHCPRCGIYMVLASCGYGWKFACNCR